MNPPEFLKAHRGWLLWRAEQVEGEPKPRKIPYYVDGTRRRGEQGGAADRRGLVSYAEASKAFAKGDYTGLGFALLADWGLVALDFDNCADFGVVEPEVEAVVAGAYAELSPSGKGVRAFFSGELPDRKSLEAKWPWGFEVFHAKGYVTITGDELEGSTGEAPPLSAAVLALYEARCGRAVAERTSAEPTGDLAELAAALAGIPDGTALGYDTWLKIGQALHHEAEGSDEALALWDEHSTRWADYEGFEDLSAKWASFGKQSGPSVARGTLLGLARDNGWVEDVAGEFEELPALANGHKPRPPFKTDKRDQIEATVGNIRMALERCDLTGLCIQLDTFRAEIMLADYTADDVWRPFEDPDYYDLQLRLERLGFKPVGKEMLRDAVRWVARRQQFDSAQDWIKGLTWDGVPRIDGFFARYFGVEAGAYASACGAYIWTAHAGRILDPGCQADMIPVLVGPQGLGKSRGVAALSPSPDFAAEFSFHEDKTDRTRKMRGCLVGELAELQGLRSRELEEIKAWVTSSHENWTPKFIEFNTKFSRRLMFWGSTNEKEFLADETGERRWLPLVVGRVDRAGLAADRNQLWAEGAARWASNGVEFAEAEALAKAEHTAFRVTDSWETAIEAWLGVTDLAGDAPKDSPILVLTDVLAGALHLDLRSIGPKEERRAGKILHVLGFERVVKRVDGKPKRGWALPDREG